MKRCGNFLIRLISAALVIGTLMYYQSAAVKRADAWAANEEQVREVEEYNALVLAAQSESPYLDGTFEGEGTGFGGTIKVSVTLKDGRITEVTVTEHSGEDPVYYAQAETLTETVVRTQSVDIDAVSGATYSSNGILSAISDAVSKAVK